MKSVAWNVWLDGKCIDTVYFSSDCDEQYVYDALTVRDGYSQRIAVRKNSR